MRFTSFVLISFGFILSMTACSKKDKQPPVVHKMYVGQSHVVTTEDGRDSVGMPYHHVWDYNYSDTIFVTVNRAIDSILFDFSDSSSSRPSYSYKLNEVENIYSSYEISNLKQSFLFKNGDSLYSNFFNMYGSGSISTSNRFSGKLVE